MGDIYKSSWMISYSNKTIVCSCVPNPYNKVLSNPMLPYTIQCGPIPSIVSTSHPMCPRPM